MKRIFVSHSRNDPDSDELVKQLDAILRRAQFDVLIDSECLGPGDTWRDEIYGWLGMCQGAVVIVAEPALVDEKPWVSWEASILIWRKTLDPDFLLVPILMSGIDTKRLEENPRFSDLHLDALNYIEFRAEALATATEIGRRFHAEREARMARRVMLATPVDDIADQIEDLLEVLPLRTVENAAERLDVDLGPWRPNARPRRILALALIQTPLDRAIGILEFIIERTAEPSLVDRILELLAPGWVNLRAARWIAVGARRPSLKPGLVLNARSKFAAEMYIRRATGKPPRTCWHMVPITGVHGEDAFEDLVAEIQEALRKTYSNSIDTDDPFYQRDPDAELRALLADFDRAGRPTMVILRMPVHAQVLLPKLQERFPYLGFLFLSGEDAPAEDECPRESFRLLEPLLVQGVEGDAWACYNRARGIIRPGDHR